MIELKIKDLGPVDEANIKLGDITVFLGPPNAGKSYTLKSIYLKFLYLNGIIKDLIKESLKKTLREYKVDKMSEMELVFILYLVLDQKNFNKIGEIIKKELNIDINIEEKDVNTIIKIRKIEKDIDLESFINYLNKIIWNNLNITEKSSVEVSDFAFKDDELLKKSFNGILIDKKEKLMIDRLLRRRTDSFISEMYYNILFKSQNDRLELEKELIIYMDKDKLEKIKRNMEVRSIDEIVNNIKDIIKGLSPLHILFSKIRRPMFIFDIYDIFTILEDHIVRNLFSQLIEEISEKIYMDINKFYKQIFNIESLIFIPYGRVSVVSLFNKVYPEKQEDLLLNVYKKDLIMFSYLNKLLYGYNALNKGEYKDEVLNIFKTVLQGNISFDKQQRKVRYLNWRFKNVDIPLEFASALANEVSGILLPFLVIPEKSLVIIEEPESQLHVSAQILMSLLFLALAKKFNHKIVFSTHSDIMAVALSSIVKYNPGREKVSELINYLLKKQNLDIDPNDLNSLVDAITSENKDLDIRFYYFDPSNGKIRVQEKSREDIIKAVPGITDAINILINWLP